MQYGNEPCGIAALADLVSIKTGKLNSNAAVENGAYPFFTCSRETYKVDTYSFDCEAVLLAGNNANGVYPVKYYKGRFDAYQRTYVIRSVDEHVLNNRYLFYALQLELDLLQSLSTGSATKFLTLTILNALKVRVPSLSDQNRIVSILGAYDDLIENNTRRIEVLEEMARRLYEEWFVQFRFPGHEGVFDTDGLPQGWRYSKLSEIASYIGRGISPKYDEEADCLVINQKCIRNQRLDVQLSRRQSKKVPVEKLIQLGDVLINSTGVGTLGRVAQVHEVLEHVTVDSHVTIARAGEFVDVDYFGSTLLSMQHFFELQGVGSTGQTELSRSRIAEADVIVPPYELQTRFGKSIRSMRLLCAQLAKKNSNLRAQRDLLLPKLISGEIDVSDIPMPT